MVIVSKPIFLDLIHPFSLSIGSRTQTPIVLVEVKSKEIRGLGEASLPPYLPENQESVISFLNGLDITAFDKDSPLNSILDFVRDSLPGNFFAKASLDIALHDFYGKVMNKPLYTLMGSNPSLMPLTSFTLGMASEKDLEKKIKEAEPFSILKVKLGGPNDQSIITTIRRHTDKPFYIDANQGWVDKSTALKMIFWLKDQGALLIEQPLPKSRARDQKWLYQNSPLPLVADESCQNISDIPQLQGLFTGINIKLMKCGGIREAMKMIVKSRELGFQIMIGCMNESSCGIMAAAALAPYCDYVDLDGPYLIKNNPFQDPELRDGRIVLSNLPGLGLIPRLLAANTP